MSTTDDLLAIIITLLVLGWLATKHSLDRIIIILERIRRGDTDRF